MANPIKIIKAVTKVGSKASAKKTAAARAKTDAIQKSSVKVKPAAKPKGNPFNQRKANEEMYSSASRGGVGKGPLGKARSARVATSKKRGK